MPGKEKKKRALQRTLAKDAKTCLKGKGSSQLFSSFFRDDMWFFWVLRIYQEANLKLGCSTEFCCVLKWFLCYFNNQQTDEVVTQGCGSNSVEDVEFSRNISENQSNSSKLFFISAFINFM